MLFILDFFPFLALFTQQIITPASNVLFPRDSWYLQGAFTKLLTPHQDARLAKWFWHLLGWDPINSQNDICR